MTYADYCRGFGNIHQQVENNLLRHINVMSNKVVDHETTIGRMKSSQG